MVYVQYYQTDLSGKLAEACGDRAVVVLDGRNKPETWKADAVKFNGFRRQKYEAYAIFKGESFTRSKAITPVISFPSQPNV